MDLNGETATNSLVPYEIPPLRPSATYPSGMSDASDLEEQHDCTSLWVWLKDDGGLAQDGIDTLKMESSWPSWSDYDDEEMSEQV
jgi:hypothetical protein